MAEHSAYIAYVRRPRRIDVINGRANGITRSQPQQEELRYREVRVKKTTSSKAWLDDPDVKRRQRVAKYKLYAVEGKVKSSFKKGMRWIKRKCSRIIHGYWRESEWYKPKKKGGREKEMVFGGVDSLIPLWKEKKKKKGKKGNSLLHGMFDFTLCKLWVLFMPSYVFPSLRPSLCFMFS